MSDLILKSWGSLDTWSPYRLQRKDYLIFLVIQQDPSLSAHAISKQLHMNSQEVRNRYAKLKDKGFFRCSLSYCVEKP